MLNDLDTLMGGHQFKKLYEKKYENIMKKYNLRKIEVEILHFISYCGGNDTARDIAKVQYVSKAHISNAIEELVIKEYISINLDKHDRRCNHLKLTDRAKEIIIEIETVRKELMNIMFEDVSIEERELLLNISRKVVENISKELKT